MLNGFAGKKFGKIDRLNDIKAESWNADNKRGGHFCPPSVFETTFLDYFFCGVAVDLAVGEVAGLAFVLGFFSSFEGLAVD